MLRPGGKSIITVPSRGHHHSTYDCLRYYPDSMRALAAGADLKLVQVATDWPPRQLESPQRHDFHQIDMANHYWGDTGAVFRKPKWRLSPRRGVNRYFTLQRANRIGDLSTHPRPKGTRLNAPTVQAPSEEA